MWTEDCFSKKLVNIGWNGVCGRVTRNARWAFLREGTNIGWDGACGRMNINARYVFLAKRYMILDGAEYVDG